MPAQAPRPPVLLLLITAAYSGDSGSAQPRRKVSPPRLRGEPWIVEHGWKALQVKKLTNLSTVTYIWLVDSTKGN